MPADCLLRNIHPLASRFSVFVPDLLGHGFTDAADLNGAAAQIAMAKHIVQLADGLGLGSFSALRFSFGALVAAMVYFERPEQVGKPVLVGTGSTFYPADEQKKMLRAAAANGMTAMADPTLESCVTRASNIVHDPSVIPAELIWIQLTVYALPIGLPPTVRRSKAANDIRADWRWHEKGVARMPDASRADYERCGHMHS